MFNKILITGSTGMVGTNLVQTLHRDTSAELLTPARKELDLSNFPQVLQYIKDKQPEVIIHCAGKVGGIQANMDAPFSFLIENLDIGRNVILAAYQNKVKHLLNLASSCMYPRNIQDHLTEDLILTGELEPTNEGYALAKILALKLCLSINQENSEFSYKTIIPCNLYGPHDKFSLEKSHLIPAVINKIDHAVKNNLPQVSIWGDGQSRREFMYVEDLTNFILFALKNFTRLPEVMNIGLGHDYSIEEYYKMIGELLDYQGTFSFDLSKPSGMRRKVVSTTKQQELGWKPHYTLNQGLQKTIEYYRTEVCHE